MSENVALPSVVCPLQWRDARCRFAGVRVSVALLAVCCALQGGCAAVPKSEPLQLTSGVQPGGLSADQFEYGRPNLLVDRTGWVLGIPSRLLLWDKRVDNHDVGPETTEAIGEYLAANELGDVKVRVNQYAPLDEWRRLRENDQIGAGWRYTLGTLNTLRYTILPGRLFGGDWYNPYTNTVSLYSDVPSIALLEAAHARNVHLRKYRGWYALAQQLPFTSILLEATTMEDVYEYVIASGDVDRLREAYSVLEPRTYMVDTASWAPILSSPAPIAVSPAYFALVGHMIARHRVLHIDDVMPAAPVADADGSGPESDGPSIEDGGASGVQHAGHVVREGASE